MAWQTAERSTVTWYRLMSAVMNGGIPAPPPGKTFGKVIARIDADGASRRPSVAIAAMFAAKRRRSPA